MVPAIILDIPHSMLTTRLMHANLSQTEEEIKMESGNDIFDIFMRDDSTRNIMKRLLKASMEESFNSIIITEAGQNYPIIYVNPAFCELTGYGPHEVVGKSPSILQGPKTSQKVLE